MRFKQYNGGGYGLNGLTPSGGPIATPLYLPTTPTAALQAVTKDYVDKTLGTISASNITGTIPAERLPAFTGADISSAGHGIFELKPTGVVAGVYNKLTVNAKGFVTAGELVDYSLLTNVPWSSITTDKPTTLEGYGVVDALKITGGAMTGALFITDAPTLSTHLTNKGYVDAVADARISQGAGKVGDIVQTSSTATPANYLRVNGSVLTKSTYAALYAVVGDTYSPAGGGAGYMGQPWRQQYIFNTAVNGTAQTWTTATSLPGTVTNSQAIVTKDRVYMLGGYINGAASSTAYTAPILADGTLGTWITATSLPATVYYSQSIVTKDRVYLLGGFINGTFSSTVYTAPISADGTLGTWTTATSLPGTVTDSQAIVTKDRVYLLGGHTGSAPSSTVYTAPILADGTLGTWTTATSLPGTVTYSQAVVTKDRVYLLGGTINSAYSSTVYTAPINADGTLGTWTTATSLPGTVTYSQAIVTKDRVYLLGGLISGTSSSTVYTAPISADGTLGTWTTATSLPGTVYYSQSIVTKDRVYLLGGYTGSASSTVYTAPFSGGTNDYMTLIANNTVNTTTQFKLPDTSLTDPAGAYSYIRAV